MRIFRLIAVIAVFSVVCSAAEKQLKQGESELYNAAVKDLSGMDFTKAIADLSAWQQKFPDSDFKDDRSAFFVQAYAGANQSAKALDVASDLLSKDLGQATTIRLLYNATWAITHIASPTPSELATGERAASQLMNYDQPLPGVSPEKWNEARADMREKATAALLYIAMVPGIQAMAKQPPDCAGAEAAYRKALTAYPSKAVLSYELGRALNCEAKANPEKFAPAIYEFLRAATIDPTLGNPATDPKKIQAFANTAYVNIHGSDEGLEQLKQEVKQSPLPPADFKIRTATEIAEVKAEIFEKENPQLALWMKIKGALSDANGDEYFNSQLKDSGVPQLSGVLVDAKPACRPKELLVAIPLPDARQPYQTEITVKLEKPLTGKPDLNVPLHWEGVPSAFVREPFMLTMDSEASKVEGLKITPCTVRK
jgi:hypothetical protein